MWVHELRDADASCGGKALGLARLVAAGLTVPAGFVIDNRAFRHAAGELALGDPDGLGHVLAEAAARIERTVLPEELVREVESRVRDLGSHVIVRSSATIEDGDAGAGAGVFSSRTAVPRAAIWEAIRAVWTSALTPLAAAYARRRGAAVSIGVIVQEFIDGAPITVYTRPPGDPGGTMLVQRGDQMVRFSRDDLPRDIETEHACLLALRAERAIGATQGADVELVQLHKQHGLDSVIQTWVVQARPIVHPTPRELAPPPSLVLAPLDDGRVWTWDVGHNPDPLSTAQSALVERVDRAEVAPWLLRVCAGYLYMSPRGEPVRWSITSTEELAARAAALEAKLEQLLGDETATSLDDAIGRYVAFYAVWASELAPLVAAARTAAAMPGTRPSSVEAMLAAAARGELSPAEVEARLGALAPAWDVAVPTFGERPGLIREAIAQATARPPPARHAGAATLASLSADLAERDDYLFARAQRLVRRALLRRAGELELATDDIFWLPLELVASKEPIDRDIAHRRAAAARSAAERAARWQMPITVGSPATLGEPLRGVGSGPRITGRVVRFETLASAAFVGAGDVVVVRAVTPALAVFVGRCAALVSETGGLLDHGAALARELGIPCVVGCREAWTRLADGMLVIVDGNAGTVAITKS